MSASPETLLALLEELRRLKSPTERMRRVARAWRHVRGLTPAERARLADAIGIEGVERVLERLSGHRLPVAELIRSLGATPDDEGSLRRLIAELADPGGRREILRRAVERTTAAVAADASDADRAADPGEAPARNGASPAVDLAGDVSPVAPAPPPVAAVPAREAPPPARSPSTAPAIAPDLAAAVVTAPPAPSVDRPARVAAEHDAADATALPRTARAPLDALRAFRADLDAGAPDDPARLAARVAAIGPGWARRRAVLAAIDAGAVRTLADLVSVLAVLATSADRRWCTLALVDRGAPSPAELRSLALAATDPAVRRRAARAVASGGT